jgi:DNA-binding protein H-NS
LSSREKAVSKQRSARLVSRHEQCFQESISTQTLRMTILRVLQAAPQMSEDGWEAPPTREPCTDLQYGVTVFAILARYLCQVKTLKGKQMDERKRESMVAYLRRRMAQVGIKVADLAAALAEDRMRAKSVRYRNAFGDTWDGKGAMPRWLMQAISAGQSLEHFAVANSSKSANSGRATVDWRQDPFAGTRLATVGPSSTHAR